MPSDVTIRELSEEDLSALVDFYNSIGWQATAEWAAKTLKFYTKSGYSRMLVAELDNKIVGRVILDTVFPPYAEIVNIIVHPAYRGHGIGTKLIQESIRRALKTGYTILYLMCDAADKKLHHFYSKLGFIPVILGDPSSPRGDTWFYYFSESTFIRQFIRSHPSACYTPSRNAVLLHGQKFYVARWLDPSQGDMLELLMRGQPGQPRDSGTMPRIGGVRLKSADLSLECWVAEKGAEGEGKCIGFFEVSIVNNSAKPLLVDIKPLLTRGLSVRLSSTSLSVGEKGEVKVEGLLFREEGFDVRLEYLSFQTIVASLRLNVNRKVNLVVSAGFDVSA